MFKGIRPKRRIPDEQPPELSDAEILRLVGASLKADAQQHLIQHEAAERHLLSRIREIAALQSYLTGQASLEDARPYLNCAQCAHILEVARRQMQSLPRGRRAQLSSPTPIDMAGGVQSHRFSATVNMWRQMRKPLLIWAALGLIAAPLLILALWRLLPAANALLRYAGPPKPILKESGLLTGKIGALLSDARGTTYLAPAREDIRAMQDAAQLVTLSLKLNNETLLAEASKAADRAGYALIEFNDERGPRVLALQEKPEAKRGRGAFFFRRDHYDGRLIIVSPHALLDDDTGRLGYECFARIPGADAFFLSGAQSSYNDQTHAENSIFNTVFAATIGPRAVCLGVHGFDEKKPGREGYPDVIISSGEVYEPYMRQLHMTLFEALKTPARAGLYDGKQFADLAGTLNRQGAMAASVNSLYAHLEFSRAARFTPALRDQLLSALTSALGDLNEETVAAYAQPGRDDAFIEFTSVSDLPTWELFYRYGNNAALVNQQQMKKLRLRAGELALLRHGDRHAVSRIYPYAGPNDRITMPGAVRRRLGVQPGAGRVQLSRLPD
ncbi:MAG: hypothetical protein ACREAM_15290 [Blastocatellia bacterium]